MALSQNTSRKCAISRKAFRVKKKIAKRLRRRKQRIQYRLRDINWPEQSKPMFRAASIHYEISDRVRGLAYGGIGAMHLLARQTGLAKAIDQKLQLLSCICRITNRIMSLISHTTFSATAAASKISSVYETMKFTWTPSAPRESLIRRQPAISAGASQEKMSKP